MSNSHTPKELLDRLREFPTATIHEAMQKYGALPSSIKPLHPAMKLCGTAYTIKSMPGDNKLFHQAIAAASGGDVLVADVSGFYEAGYWGELLSVAAQVRGIAGLVIDGCVRDADQIEALNFPVFCRGLCIQGTTKHGTGSLNQPIILGNITIQPGDVVVGDRDGVVIVPAARAEETIAACQVREEKEARTLAALKEGKTTLEIYGWD